MDEGETMAKVDMSGLPGHDVSNLTVWGWEWVTEAKTTFQIVGLSSVSGPPRLHVKVAGDGWVSHGKMDDKWSFDGTREGFLRVVRAFLESSGTKD